MRKRGGAERVGRRAEAKTATRKVRSEGAASLGRHLGVGRGNVSTATLLVLALQSPARCSSPLPPNLPLSFDANSRPTAPPKVLLRSP